MIGLHFHPNGLPGFYRILHWFSTTVSRTENKEEKIEFIDMPESIRNQYQYFTQANMNKFRSLVPNFMFRTLEESVEDYVQNHLMKDDPYL